MEEKVIRSIWATGFKKTGKQIVEKANERAAKLRGQIATKVAEVDAFCKAMEITFEQLRANIKLIEELRGNYGAAVASGSLFTSPNWGRQGGGAEEQAAKFKKISSLISEVDADKCSVEEWERLARNIDLDATFELPFSDLEKLRF